MKIYLFSTSGAHASQNSKHPQTPKSITLHPLATVCTCQQGDNKLPTSSGSFHFSSGLFAPPHHPLKALSLPPPPVSSPTSHIDALPLPMFHPPTLPPPPGLLHILMSAEKCQVSHLFCVFSFHSVRFSFIKLNSLITFVVSNEKNYGKKICSYGLP
ncbi:hypothetical protein NQ314_009688 [Rhamnusium bicolor]|uniref:Uncharacterized protein n=1 Tax=Rhamnusium bicolor TaxID=1586634 RepID=A0AAV8XZC2_9CUCU|nr:hypothetical protein NQ314_009688 [Rhamnusium bicolor]